MEVNCERLSPACDWPFSGHQLRLLSLPASRARGSLCDGSRFLDQPVTHSSDWIAILMRELISEQEIRDRVREMGAKITAEYSEKPLTILGVLTGSIVLLADLIRSTSVPLRVALVQASSYGGTRTTPGELKVNVGLLPDLHGRDVLIVDDIFDTGKTLKGLYTAVAAFRPNSIRSAVLLWKTERSCVQLVPDFYCFTIPNEFVVGYGLDFNDEFRHLPYIGIPDEADLIRAGGIGSGGIG